MPERFDSPRDFMHGSRSFDTKSVYCCELIGGEAITSRSLSPVQLLVTANLAAMLDGLRGKPPWVSGHLDFVIAGDKDVLRPATAIGLRAFNHVVGIGLLSPLAVFDVAPVRDDRLRAFLACPSVQLIAVFSATDRHADAWIRCDDGWIERRLEVGAEFALPEELGAPLHVADAYRRIKFGDGEPAIASVVEGLPDLLDLEATEEQAAAYAKQLADACYDIEADGMEHGLKPLDIPHIWLSDLRHGDIVDLPAAARAITLWERVKAWKKAERARNPRYALRELMSDISERAYCASWHFDTEYTVWQLLQGLRTEWARFDVSDPVDAALLDAVRKASASSDGWWWWPDGADGAVFVPLNQWLQIYVRTLDDPDRGLVAVVVRENGTKQTYLGRKGVARYIVEHGHIIEPDGDEPE